MTYSYADAKPADFLFSANGSPQEVTQKFPIAYNKNGNSNSGGKKPKPEPDKTRSEAIRVDMELAEKLQNLATLLFHRGQLSDALRLKRLVSSIQDKVAEQQRS